MDPGCIQMMQLLKKILLFPLYVLVQLKYLPGLSRSVFAFFRKRKIVPAALAVIALLVLIDYGVGKKQETILREIVAKKERLSKMANYMILPDIHDAWDIKGEPGKYEAVIKIDNVADEVIYVTYPEVKAYVQTSFYWQELPVHDPEGVTKTQLSVLDTGQYLYHNIISIDKNIEYTPYQVPYYMHVRFRISVYVLPESVFDEKELLERYTDVYFYLKPFFINDETILKEMTWEENKVPIMIPMPPH
jgi:hypothetical protein